MYSRGHDDGVLNLKLVNSSYLGHVAVKYTVGVGRFPRADTDGLLKAYLTHHRLSGGWGGDKTNNTVCFL